MSATRRQNAWAVKEKASPMLDSPFDFMVRMRGLEPPRCHHHRLLRPARLPVPPHPRTETHYTNRGLTVSRKAAGFQLRSGRKLVPDLIRTPVSAISPIHVRVSAICEMTSSPIIVGAVGTIAIADAVPKDAVPSIVRISSRSAIVPPPITRIMTVHKLCALLIEVRL